MFFIIISVIAILFCILYIIKIPERTGRYNQKIEAFSQSISNPQKIVVSNQPNKAFSCQQCGREIGTNADFCTHCGNRVN
jgi:hypothetical protein